MVFEYKVPHSTKLMFTFYTCDNHNTGSEDENLLQFLNYGGCHCGDIRDASTIFTYILFSCNDCHKCTSYKSLKLDPAIQSGQPVHV